MTTAATIEPGWVVCPRYKPLKENRMLPTPEQNPDGLHGRYKITKVDGTPVDPEAIYFILRIDGEGDDPIHIAACNNAINEYCNTLAANRHLPKLVEDLRAIANRG